MEVSTKNILGGKGGRCVTLTTHPHLVPRSLKSRAVPLLPLWNRVACSRVKHNLKLEIFNWQPHHLHVTNVMKSGSLKLLEPSGPHRACYGTTLPYYTLSLNKTAVSHWTPSSPAHSPVAIKSELFYHFDSIRAILNQFFVFSVVSNETGNIVQRN